MTSIGLRNEQPLHVQAINEALLLGYGIPTGSIGHDCRRVGRPGQADYPVRLPGKRVCFFLAWRTQGRVPRDNG